MSKRESTHSVCNGDERPPAAKEAKLEQPPGLRVAKNPTSACILIEQLMAKATAEKRARELEEEKMLLEEEKMLLEEAEATKKGSEPPATTSASPPTEISTNSPEESSSTQEPVSTISPKKAEESPPTTSTSAPTEVSTSSNEESSTPKDPVSTSPSVSNDDKEPEINSKANNSEVKAKVDSNADGIALNNTKNERTDALPSASETQSDVDPVSGNEKVPDEAISIKKEPSKEDSHKESNSTTAKTVALEGETETKALEPEAAIKQESDTPKSDESKQEGSSKSSTKKEEEKSEATTSKGKY